MNWPQDVRCCLNDCLKDVIITGEMFKPSSSLSESWLPVYCVCEMKEKQNRMLLFFVTNGALCGRNPSQGVIPLQMLVVQDFQDMLQILSFLSDR